MAVSKTLIVIVLLVTKLIKNVTAINYYNMQYILLSQTLLIMIKIIYYYLTLNKKIICFNLSKRPILLF